MGQRGALIRWVEEVEGPGVQRREWGPGSGCREDPKPWGGLGVSVGPFCPAPLLVSPQWFKRPEAAAERMPGAPPRLLRAGRAAQDAAPQWGRAARAGGRGARRPAPRTVPPPQCAAAGAGSLFNPIEAETELASRSRSAAASQREAAGPELY